MRWGGLTALLLTHEQPDRILRSINIERNIAPEDCFLSRQIIAHPADTPAGFVKAFIDRVRHRAEYGFGLYAAALPAKVRDMSYQPIFTSMLGLSGDAPLMKMFTGLSCPRAFIHGAQNRHLS
ncbi:hypothetical protein [Loktanella sp. 3ANDIMAR09]|uniref:hypothetical protein n=1 Tax=Loktanella sp. 3ANDIMAR09 TaxID=1225657 RepID=UPI001C10978F|nr:hypothetical protein [Loktanella sp. 3ANDIMAR09]